MNYNKPEITSLASASFVIQGTKELVQGKDSGSSPYESISAYQADE